MTTLHRTRHQRRQIDIAATETCEVYRLQASVRENMCNNSRNVKSHVFMTLKKKRLKNVKT